MGAKTGAKGHYAGHQRRQRRWTTCAIHRLLAQGGAPGRGGRISRWSSCATKFSERVLKCSSRREEALIWPENLRNLSLLTSAATSVSDFKTRS